MLVGSGKAFFTMEGGVARCLLSHKRVTLSDLPDSDYSNDKSPSGKTAGNSTTERVGKVTFKDNQSPQSTTTKAKGFKLDNNCIANRVNTLRVVFSPASWKKESLLSIKRLADQYTVPTSLLKNLKKDTNDRTSKAAKAENVGVPTFL